MGTGRPTMAAFVWVLKLVRRITGRSSPLKETQGYLKERPGGGVLSLGARAPEQRVSSSGCFCPQGALFVNHDWGVPPTSCG